jgi:hypothetical protein
MTKIFKPIVLVAGMAFACEDPRVQSPMETIEPDAGTTVMTGPDAGPVAKPEYCPGKDWVAECAGATPRLEVSVVDETGAPVPNVLVYQFPMNLLKESIDTQLYPAQDGLERKIQYDACTGPEGKVTICGFDPASLPVTAREIVAVKSGYTRGTTGEVAIAAGDVKQLAIKMDKNPSATDERILTMTCQNWHREVSLLASEDVQFTMAPFGKAIDTLVPDPAHPLRDFDTFFVGLDASMWQCFGELLVPEKNAKLIEWVKAGGLLFFGQQNDSKFARSTGCPTSANVCPNEVLPPDYRFELLAEKGGCNDFVSGQPMDTSHMLTDGITDWTWEYNEAKEGLSTKTKKNLAFDAVNGATVNRKMWSVLVAGPSDSAEIDKKTADCGTEYAGSESAIHLMEASLGKGKILVGQSAYEQGSQGYHTGGLTDPAAIAAMQNVIKYLKAQVK